jgi:Amt family ammonium transporter
MIKKLPTLLALGLLWLACTGAALAQDAAPAAAPAAAEVTAAAQAVAAAPQAAAAETPAAKPTPHKGDVAWMMVATLLVVMMVIPGLALFYGGLLRSKNTLSALMQVIVVFSLVMVLWAVYGYSLAFGGEGLIIANLDKAFLAGITMESVSDTFTAGVVIPELIFVAFQATFAGITCAIIVGAFAERIKFSAVLIFTAIWFTFSYIPVAHMVWGAGGMLIGMGKMDFAGGTVVHLQSAVAALVGAYVIGKRIGYGKEAMAPHNLPLAFVGAALLWVGWFGFNAGSALEANSNATLAFLNTLMATAAAVLAWCLGETLLRGKASVLGAASGAVAGLVAITPACGYVGPMGAIVIGLAGGFLCLWGVNGLKKMLGADDTLDVFGLHGVGGIVGGLLTGVFAAPLLGGGGDADFTIAGQLYVQVLSMLVAAVWSGVVAFVAFKLADMLVGLRVPEEAEREGLDISSHGEAAYGK